MTEPTTEVNPPATPVGKIEFISERLFGIPDRIKGLLSPIDPIALESVHNAVGKERLKQGNEIEADFIEGFEIWEGLAKKAKNKEILNTSLI